jgi:hypothetical protein
MQRSYILFNDSENYYVLTPKAIAALERSP